VTLNITPTPTRLPGHLSNILQESFSSTAKW